MIAILAGSSRKNSNTLRVGRAIKRIAGNRGVPESQIKLVDFEDYDVPFYNGENLHKDNLNTFQQKVYDAMQQASLIFFLSPEYNWFPSAEVINLINRFGERQFTECWAGKVFATCGISSGRGGRIPAVQLSYVLNKLINTMNLTSVVSAKMFESQFTPGALDANGNSLGNLEFDKGLELFVDYNLKLNVRLGLNKA